MEIEVEYLSVKKKVKISDDARVKDLLEKFDINPETVIVRCDGKILTSDRPLKDCKKVEILSFVSSG